MSLPRRLAVLAGLALALLGIALPAASADPSSTDVKISDVQNQPGQVRFLLSTTGGEQLTPGSVVVTAGGRTLQATAQIPSSASDGGAATPLRVVYLVLDTSGSMAGDGINAARSAAKQYAASLPADVQVGLVAFSNVPHLLLRATVDRNALYAAVQGLKANGNTSLYDAILTAVDAMKGLPPNAVRRLLILSDGADNTSHNSESAASGALKIVDVSADVVAFRLPGNEQVLEQLAQASGGKVLPAADAGHLAGAFAAAASVFRQQLEVTVKIPADLANTRQTLTITANGGSATVTAETTVVLPVAAPAAGSGSSTVAAPMAATSSKQLWLVVAIAFVAILSVALAVLFLPVMAAARAERASRLAEMHRYRVVGALGADGAMPAPAASQTPTAVTQRTLSFVDRTLRAREGARERVVSSLEGAGMRMRPEEWAVIQAAAILALAAAFGLLLGNFFAAILGGALGYGGCRLFLRIRTSRREAAFLAQIPDTLQLIAGSLRSGFSLNQALNTVVREGTEPTASEFTRALTEARLGAELENALDDVAVRMRCDDLGWVVMAIRISREVGGNLAEVLGNTVTTMRQRSELRGLVRVLSAEGRISAKILMALPFFLAAFMLLFRRGYINPLFHNGVGWAMIAGGVVMLTIGGVWLNRLVKIEV